jgi:hypothetical protein
VGKTRTKQEEIVNGQAILVGKPERKRFLGVTGVDGKII